MTDKKQLMLATPRPSSNSERWISYWHLLGCLCFGLLVCLSFPTARAQTTSTGSTAVSSPERVKAAFLYKFLNYVDWPSSSFESPDSPYVVGVIDADDVEAELAKLSAGTNVNHRAMTVKHFKAGDSLNGIHVLFVGQAERRRLQSVLKPLQSQPVLLVTETDGALSQGSMINFRIVDERVRFEVALDTVEKSGLSLNTRLLSVAITVVKGTP